MKTHLKIIGLFFFMVMQSYRVSAQAGKLLALDINSFRVLVDSIGLKQRIPKVVDTLRFKFDPFAQYSSVYNSKWRYWLLECDTALIIINDKGKVTGTMHKTGDVEGLVYHPVEDRIYGAVWKGNTYYFAEIDVVNRNFKTIRSFSAGSPHTATLDYDRGYYYIISDTRGLYQIDIRTGIKTDSVKYFTTSNCRCNTFDAETGKMATICNVGGKDIMQWYDPYKRTLDNMDTLGKYGSGYFGFASAALDQNTGNWYVDLGKKIGVKNIRSNTRMDTFYVPFKRIRSFVLDEGLCYRPLTIQSLKVNDPKCFHSGDGRVELKVQGGRPACTYTLNRVDQDTLCTFGQLKAGPYNISVKDKYGFCVLQHAFTLTDPPAFQVGRKIPDTTLCSGQAWHLNLYQKEIAQNALYTPTGEIFYTDSITLNKAGIYVLKMLNANGCEARDTFAISKIDLEVSHDFLVPTYAGIYDTVVAVNVSIPSADKVQWYSDKPFFSRRLADSGSLACYFADTGAYHITLKSNYKDCGFELTKAVRVLPAGNAGKGVAGFGYAAPLIQTFSVSPNPNDGQHFRMYVHLRDTADFSIYKIDAATGYITAEQHFKGQQETEVAGFVSLRAEVYYLKLIAGRESRVIKVVAMP